MCIGWTNKEITIVNMHGATIKLMNPCFTSKAEYILSSWETVNFSRRTLRVVKFRNHLCNEQGT